MLLSTPVGHAPTLLSGFGAVATVSDPLKKLQLALVGLAAAAHNNSSNPGDTSGTLVNGYPPDQTMSAIAGSMHLITRYLPTWTGVSLSIAFGVGASTDRAKQAVLDYASELQKAVLAATAAAPYYTKPPTTAPDTAMQPSPMGPWYKTWWGIGAIAVGGLGLITLLLSARRPAPAAKAA